MPQAASEFYDIRGNRAFDANNLEPGSRSMPIYFASPYQWSEKHMRKMYDAGASTFLDLGCGTGIHTAMSALIGFRSKGVDISPKSIEYARHLISELDVAVKPKFEVGNILDELRLDEKFDVIFMSGTLYYLNLNIANDLIFKKLNPGGCFICVETVGDNFILNWYRLRKNSRIQHRDEATLKNLVTRNSINNFSLIFDDHNIVFFDCFILFCSTLRKAPFLLHPLARICSFIDRFILNKLPVSFLAFKFVFIGYKSKNKVM